MELVLLLYLLDNDTLLKLKRTHSQENIFYTGDGAGGAALSARQ
jgi:hypothetical protein